MAEPDELDEQQAGDGGQEGKGGASWGYGSGG